MGSAECLAGTTHVPSPGDDTSGQRTRLRFLLLLGQRATANRGHDDGQESEGGQDEAAGQGDPLAGGGDRGERGQERQ
ncbi:MAG: hypothetical protein L0H26_11115 [Microlunatus sp.]|nr:hypothetical protein [Microlunatus sp.]